MTREQALQTLAEYSYENTLHFNILGNPLGAYINTSREKDGLYELRDVLGGIVDIARKGNLQWRIADEKALEIMKELLPIPAFRRSGKYHVVLNFIKQCDPTFVEPPLFKRQA